METHNTSPQPDPKQPVTERIKSWYRDLPDKKRYFELVTAFLSIPVLLTVLIGNLMNLQNRSEQPTRPSPVQIPAGSPSLSPMPTPSGTSPAPSASPGPSLQCTPGIGPIDITYPKNGGVVTSDPVCIEISRQSDSYCAVVWSYRINDGTWSDFTDRNICIYGLSAGTKQLDVRIKSVVTGDQIVLERTFSVAGSMTPTPTQASPSATPSGL